MDPNPDSIFVIGNPRSGTTLLRLILDSHSLISIPPECGFVVWLSKQYGKWMKDDLSSVAMRMRFVSDLLACRKFETWKLDGQAIARVIEQEQPINYSELCAAVYLEFARSTHKSKIRFWGDKNNFHIHHLDLLAALFPQARFLHIVRDGRDVACSYREVMASMSDSPYFPKLPVDAAAVASEWSNNVLKVDKFLLKLPENQVRTISYEDLVERPDDTIRGVCEWLGLSFETEMMSYFDRNLKQGSEPAATMDWKKRTLEPISAKTVGQYRRLLTEDDVKIFNITAHLALENFGYV